MPVIAIIVSMALETYHTSQQIKLISQEIGGYAIDSGSYNIEN
ncbi:hypothetical protein P7G31_07540 [Streptococcus parauberis]|uniref:Uncharacterized protein n=1 Tax=Streptococcus parauberis TaxID=1348 RepID=A0AAE4HVR8_9STRE|nr:hypothetical protein [Streptococcus parauberis]MDT2732095.1 hypothetical protein [Streptococcus parauberis]